MKGEFYKMEFRAWNLGTVDLTLEQEAAYLRLCHAMYDVGGPVPNSVRFLMAIFRCGNVKATTLVAQLIAAGKIAVTADGRLFNHRVSEELANREKVSSARRLAGERGGSARRVTPECTPSEGRLDPECSPSDRRVPVRKSLENNDQGEAFASTLRSREEEIREDPPKAPKGAKDGEPEGFAEWFAAYPKRDGANPRAPAASRYAATVKAGATPETLLRAVRAYAAELQRKGKVGTEFVKQAQFWLSPKDRLWEHYGRAAEPQTDRQAEVAAYVATWSDDRWREEVRMWRGRGGHWPWRHMTPAPDDPRTAAPRHILAENNIHPGRAAA